MHLRVFILFFSVLWTCSVSAQTNDIPNGNFEGWQDTFAYAIPEGYVSTSNSWGLSPRGVSNVFRSENAFSGNYALEVRTVDSDGSIVPGIATNAMESGGFFCRRFCL
jgi:predicted phage tail protein